MEEISCIWIERLILIQGNLNKISSKFFVDMENHFEMYKENQKAKNSKAE